jgi:hypothetical protein
MNEPLTSAGQQRREAILLLGRRAARRRRQQRHLARGAMAVAATACAILLVLALETRWPAPGRHPSPHAAGTYVVTPTPPAIPTSHLVIGRIETDPTIVDRWSVAPQPPQWQRIDDDDLIRSLADQGQSAGLISAEGETTLVMSGPLADASGSR